MDEVSIVPVSVNNGTVFVPSPPSTIPGQVIGSKSYNPNPSVTTGTTSASYADVDATNLAVTFTVPASGSVIVRLEAHASSAVTSNYGWGVRDGSTDLAGSTVLDAIAENARITASFIITGLTPGASKTYKWSHARISGVGTTQMSYGQVSIAVDYGAAVLLVLAL